MIFGISEDIDVYKSNINHEGVWKFSFSLKGKKKTFVKDLVSIFITKGLLSL